jgi:hypothetical protein
MPAAKPLTERFWEKVQKRASGCWEWTASVDEHGRGRINYKGYPLRAHRASWFIHFGQWPTLQVNHRCDNPLCVNPGHLYEGTQVQNVADAVARDRTTHGVRHGAARLTDEKVEEIRRLYAFGYFQREIAVLFGVSKGAIQGVVTGSRWRRSFNGKAARRK